MRKVSSDEYYEEIYPQVLNKGNVGLVSNIIHKKLESRAKEPIDSILELGAGSGQHYKFVTQKFKFYFETDLRLQNIPNRRKEQGKAIRRKRLNAENLESIKTSSINRLVVSCLLIHLNRPEKALQEWRRVVKTGGP